MEFMGLYGFNWFMGVVESRDDPLKLGRVKVRIFGLHSESRAANIQEGEGISVEDLPWAHPMQDIRSAAMHGIGHTPLGPVEGTHVVGFARDGDAYQDLVIMGTIGGYNKEGPKNTGFWDPNMHYPESQYIGEQDTHRLARNENINDTIIQVKRDMEINGIPLADGGSWDEPSTEYNAEYPFNHVHETESGHHFEEDDTPGSERLHEWHRTGTFKEIYPNGREVKKVVNDHYTLILGSDYLLVDGKCHVTVTGDATMYVQGNVVEKVDGNVDQTVGGNVTQNIGGNVTASVGGNISASAGGSVEVSAGSDATLNASGTATVKGASTILNSPSGGGTVCQMHTCAFTGAPHPEGSKTVFGEK